MVRASRLTIRAKATLAATTALAIALVAGALLIVTLQRNILIGGVESNLEARADDLASIVTDGGIPDTLTTTGEEQQLAQIIDPSGRVVAASANIEGEGPIAATDAEGSNGSTNVVLPVDDEGTFRLVSRSVDAANGRYTILVAQSTSDVSASVDALVVALIIVIPALLAIVALATWLIVGRTLRPIEDIRAEVAEITGRELHRRVPQHPVDDEVGRLARTMNHMLERLDDSAKRQRRFVEDASHELRTPLTSMRAQLEVDIDHPESANVGESQADLLRETVHLQRLVDDLLALARMDDTSVDGEPENVDLDDILLREAERIRGRDAVEVDTSGISGAQVWGSRQRLTRAMRNLVDNAERHATGRIVLAVTEDDGSAVIAVGDDGNGVPADQRERVFERFARLDESRSRDQGGSGLGLAIAREIIEGHHGSITIADSAAGGASFIVRIPGRPPTGSTEIRRQER